MKDEGTEGKGTADESESQAEDPKQELPALSKNRNREVISKEAYMKKKRRFWFQLQHFDIEVGPVKAEDHFEMMIAIGLNEFIDLKKVMKKEIEMDKDFIIDALFDHPEEIPRVLAGMTMWGACNVTKSPKIHPDPKDPEDRIEGQWYWSDLDAEDQERLINLSNGEVEGAEWILTGKFRPDESPSNPDGNEGREVREAPERDMGDGDVSDPPS